MNDVRKAIEAIRSIDGNGDLRQEHPVYVPKNKHKSRSYSKVDRKTLWDLFKKHSENKYKIDAGNEKQVYTILRYFVGDENFNKQEAVVNDASLKKGILIYGDYGVGKSWLFEILHAIGSELIMKFNCKDVWFNKISAGAFVEEYMASIKDPNTNFNLDNFYKGTLYIDDLGFEKKAFNKTELFAELLFERNRRGVRTFVTTNNSPSEITNRYGDRIGDRLSQDFNFIKWHGKTRRP